eukprot:749077-Hanusia_phi.AAC.2
MLSYQKLCYSSGSVADWQHGDVTIITTIGEAGFPRHAWFRPSVRIGAQAEFVRCCGAACPGEIHHSMKPLRRCPKRLIGSGPDANLRRIRLLYNTGFNDY